MKKTIFNLLIAIIAVSACKEHEMELYNEEPRVKFEYSISYINFDDYDYAHKIMEKEFYVEITLMGNTLTEPRTLVLKKEKVEGAEELNVKLLDKYTFGVGTYFLGDSVGINEVGGVKYSGAKIKVVRPSKFTREGEKNTPLEVKLTFATKEENPLHQFNPGIVEKNHTIIKGNYYIQFPKSWSWQRWGSYSLSKYLFMMDVTGETYDELDKEDKNRESHKKIYDAYKEYIKTNPEITDEYGVGISFPETI